MVMVLFSILVSISVGLMFIESIVSYGLYAFLLMAILSSSVGVIISSWFGMVLLLVYIGGLMVMFGYFLAICPNQKAVFKGSVVGCTFLFFWFVSFWVGGGGGLESGFKMAYYELFQQVNLSLLVILALSLLLALVVVVKIIERKEGPLRSFSRGCGLA